jgi:hypothetical protein
MDSNKLTDESIVRMRLNKLVPIAIAGIIATNVVSLTVQRIANLEEKEHYNVEASKRRLRNSEIVNNLKQELNHKDLRLEILQKELMYCQKK